MASKCKPKTCKEALAEWKSKTGESPDNASKIKFMGCIPPIKVMDQRILNQFKAAYQISLSTNIIERFGVLNLDNLKILSLARNSIRRFERLEGVPNLEELWVSYNEIDKLSGIECLQKLKVLYLSNNNISDITELETLQLLPNLQDVVFKGNPIYHDREPQRYRYDIIKILPLKGGKLDGTMITPQDIVEANKVVEEGDVEEEENN